ncbi:hypothetical protein BDV25DRAFT_135840 [Aspergillus avenaceus]|uniref:BTB domain-containing protein n=1 Tax=Aspergillus avenaceus TaxID=36643 RepID=A0A5N6U722_ASPAV|nr:hypothetical protein BDV25DRAFT_135840 [Aspergillus avenaceus]
MLSMASPVFAKLFTSNFSEGIQMTFCSCPTISLHEDDPAAMRTILRILHHQEPTANDSMNAEKLAVIAIHCNKYDCIEAVRPWTFKWFGDLSFIATTEDYGYMLLAAHLFGSAEQFSKISVAAQVQLSSKLLTKWDVVDIMRLLPDTVQTNITNGIETLLH